MVAGLTLKSIINKMNIFLAWFKNYFCKKINDTNETNSDKNTNQEYSLTPLGREFSGENIYFKDYNNFELKIIVDFPKLMAGIFEYLREEFIINNIVEKPVYILSYSTKSKNLGHASNNRIVIHKKKHLNVYSFVNTILHEIRHYMQNQIISIGNSDMQTYYHKNCEWFYRPVEIDARNFANLHNQKCIDFLFNIGYVINTDIHQAKGDLFRHIK